MRAEDYSDYRGVIHVPDKTWDPNGQVVEGWDALVGERIVFLCPHCGCWCDADIGGADDRPEACDPCWHRLEQNQRPDRRLLRTPIDDRKEREG